ncbi:MAG TPA: hypothetical protein VK671_11465 [Mucilaginibacter sp.]|nr:hypothetical protein [Mucilaginibacter sp.]
MKTKYLSLIIAGLFFCATACKKDRAVTPGNKVIDIANKNVDIYVAGYVQAANNNFVAAYWKNGTLVKLGDSVNYSTANAIAVSGNDVYVVGTTWPINQNSSSYSNAVVWKNGVTIMLSPDSTGSEANSIAIQGNDVYVVGYIHDLVSQTANGTQYNAKPIYWKNGVPATLPNAGSITSVAVNGNDVYFGGSANSGSFKYSSSNNGKGYIAAYWKNGALADTLNSPSSYLPGYSTQVNGIAVNSTGVYTVGVSGYNAPECWTGTVAAPITGGTTSSTVYSIAANGADVYVVGSTFFNGNNFVATYWKNNVPTPLAAGPSGDLSSASYATGISLYGTDVYIAGEVSNNSAKFLGAYYWKNDVPTQLTNGGSKAAFVTGIAVVAQ